MTNPELEAIRRYLDAPTSEAVRRQPLRHLISGLLGSRAGLAKVWLTRLGAPYERRKASRLPSSGLRLHLGSGRSYLASWTNVDLVGYRADLRWDITRPLPLPPACASAIFSEHVLEHLPLRAGLAVLQDAHRLLEPLGVLRVAVPDAERYARSYLSRGTGVIEVYRPGRPTPLIAMQEIYYRHGHQTAYDAETLSFLFRAAGFSDPRVAESGVSEIDPCPDSTERRTESVYVEATRS